MKQTQERQVLPSTKRDTTLPKVEFEGMNANVAADDGSALRIAEQSQRDGFHEAATRAVLATYGPDEPPTSRALKERGESVMAFADGLDIGSMTFRVLYSELLGDGRHDAFLQASIDALEPRDAYEALLCAQMSAVHANMMNMSEQLAKAELLARCKFYEGAANRLARTYVAQLEALRKHRGNGTQTVRHVHINEGGQAVVADTVNHIRREGGDGEI